MSGDRIHDQSVLQPLLVPLRHDWYVFEDLKYLNYVTLPYRQPAKNAIFTCSNDDVTNSFRFILLFVTTQTPLAKRSKKAKYSVSLVLRSLNGHASVLVNLQPVFTISLSISFSCKIICTIDGWILFSFVNFTVNYKVFPVVFYCYLIFVGNLNCL